MQAKIVIPFLVISTAILASGRATAAVELRATSAPTVTVEQVKNPDPLVGPTLAMRLRAFDTTRGNSLDKEVLLGSGDLGSDSEPMAADGRYQAGSNSFSLSLQGGTLSAMLNGTTVAIKDVFTVAGLTSSNPLDTLRIGITDGVKGQGQISLDNLVLSGSDWNGNRVEPVKLGSMAGVDFGGTVQWDVTGLNFMRDFELQGTLGLLAERGRMRSAGDINRVDFAIGNGPILQSAVPDISTWVMMITGFAFVGSALRGRRASEADKADEAAPAIA